MWLYFRSFHWWWGDSIWQDTVCHRLTEVNPFFRHQTIVRTVDYFFLQESIFSSFFLQIWTYPFIIFDLKCALDILVPVCIEYLPNHFKSIFSFKIFVVNVVTVDWCFTPSSAISWRETWSLGSRVNGVHYIINIWLLAVNYILKTINNLSIRVIGLFSNKIWNKYLRNAYPAADQ